MKTLPIFLLTFALGSTVFAQEPTGQPAAADAVAAMQERKALSKALIYAAAVGDIAEAERLLAAGADIHHDDECALGEAIRNAQVESVQFLLEKGADPNKWCPGMEVPKLTGAIPMEPVDAGEAEKQARIIQLLLAHGANPNKGDTAIRPLRQLCLAADTMPLAPRLEILGLLIDAGAKVDTTADAQESVLMTAAQWSEREIVQRLVQAGAEIGTRDEGGFSPLHYAARNKLDASVILYLLECGAELNAVSQNGHTALMEAAMSGSPEGIRVLLDKGADINARDEYGCTPLMLAAACAEIDNVRALVEAGADVTAKDSGGDTALDHASGGHEDEDDAPAYEAIRTYLEGVLKNATGK